MKNKIIGAFMLLSMALPFSMLASSPSSVSEVSPFTAQLCEQNGQGGSTYIDADGDIIIDRTDGTTIIKRRDGSVVVVKPGGDSQVL